MLDSYKTVLVVDDDVNVLILIDTMLKKLGYPVVKALDAELALHLIKSLSPNLFILDVLMPGMNGFELCEAIRKVPHTAKTPVIMLTALDNLQSKKKALEAGANAFVPKTDLLRELIPQIQALLTDSPPERSGETGTPAYPH
ncbi:MAG: response regulator [Chloroflexi bacterium]|nr:response regulator [Chloroflexota bacterium]